MKTLIGKKDARVVCFHTTDQSSLQNQQPVIYKYLPVEYRRKMKGRVENVSYSQKNGFTESVREEAMSRYPFATTGSYPASNCNRSSLNAGVNFGNSRIQARDIFPERLSRVTPRRPASQRYIGQSFAVVVSQRGSQHETTARDNRMLLLIGFPFTD